MTFFPKDAQELGHQSGKFTTNGNFHCPDGTPPPPKS